MSANKDEQDEAGSHSFGGETAADRETRIRERAYYRRIREGLPPGRDFDYWLQAEKEIDVEAQRAPDA